MNSPSFEIAGQGCSGNFSGKADVTDKNSFCMGLMPLGMGTEKIYANGHIAVEKDNYITAGDSKCRVACPSASLILFVANQPQL